jgi:outer membrane protein assembly factor BamA
LLGAGGCATAQYEPLISGPKVNKVRIEGDRQVESGPILDGLALHQPRGLLIRDYARFDPLALETDAQRIEAYYQRRGFFGARVADTQVTSTHDGVDITYSVKEGGPTRIKETGIENAPPIERRASLDHAHELLRPGEQYDAQRYDVAKRELREWMLANGYAYADLSGEVLVDRALHSASVKIDLDPGPLARFGQLYIKGTKRVPSSLIENRVAWEQGRRFDPRDIELTRGRLHALERFGYVRITYPREETKPDVDMTVEVAESAPRRLRLGGGVGVDPTHWELRARAEYLVRGVFWDKREDLLLSVRPSYQFLRDAPQSEGLGAEARARLTRLDFLLPLVSGSAEAVLDQVAIEPYSRRGPQFSLGLNRPFLRDRLTAQIGWRFLYYDIYQVSPAIDAVTAAQIGIERPYRAGLYEQELRADWRDDPLDPSSGLYAGLHFEEGGDFAGGQFQFSRGILDVRGYLPLGSRLVLATRAQYGRALSGTLPVTQRFFGGGASDHRGFGQRELSPMATSVVDGVTQRVEIGGEELFESSLEARVHLFKIAGEWFGLALFTDAGDVTLVPGELDLLHLHHAIGTGVRYHTVVGPIRLDFAYRLNRVGPAEPGGDRRWALAFSLGQAF